MKKFTLISALLLAACGSDDTTDKSHYAEAGTPAYGDVLVDASIGDAANFVPFVGADSASHAVTGRVYDTILKYDKNLNIVGNLAEKWDVSDDNLSITFHLKQGVTFSDGMPLTAQDVKATFDTILAPTTRTPYAGDYQMVEKFELIDDHTFKVTYPKPFSPALSSWISFSVLPKHILDQEEDIHTGSLSRKPIGSGPYTLTNWDEGKEIVLSANPTHHAGKPYITQRRTRLIPDVDTQFLELKAERIDSMGLKPVQYTRLTGSDTFTARYNKYNYLGFAYTYMGFKLDHPLFNDKRVRQALSYATPRQDLINGVLMGQGVPIACIFKPGTWACNETLTPYAYNLEKARKLLADAGWKDTDGNGILDKNGRDFTFHVTTNQGNDSRIKSAEIMQQAFKAVGVDMKVRVQEWSTFIENTIHKRDFEAFILGWSLTPEPDPFDIWHSSKTGEREFNVVGFANDEADELMVKARETFDQATRKQYLDRVQEIIHDEQPYLFLYAPYSLIALHKRIKNVEPAPAGISHNEEEWYVPENQQRYTAMQP